ncbi:hypothetical protein A6D6_01846 [Alcanivorax xiamenensis]|uniref:Ancillary SecYEG translocon subunit n=1 Tax=Alcanivorax xiamenensis TaxID=1177156 RepID=A0ABQ6Y9N1_9GAMM|nr:MULTISPECIES: tetratricopeptide repeat protein [Alcanivorax]KAF0806028.1 hypothetical protein A6D6_01846 [Alcanivorax xiamenensis]
MADYIRDEEEQAERLRNWWQKNGVATVVVIVLAVGSMIGWRQWQQHQSVEAGKASGLYEKMISAMPTGAGDGDAGVVKTNAEALIDQFAGSSYAGYAHLALAKLAVQNGDLGEAASQLRLVVDKPATKELEHVARLRLVRVLIAQNELDAAGKELGRTWPEAMQGQALELKGDVAKARQQWDEARDAYASALEAMGGQGGSDRVQMKLDDLNRQS